MIPKAFNYSRFAAGVGGASVVILVILAYAAYAAYPYLAGPSLRIRAETSESGITTLSGTTERVSFLDINGHPTALEESGAFSEKRAYPSGYTEITATARDRFGHTVSRTITFVNTPPTISRTITFVNTPPTISHGTEEEN